MATADRMARDAAAKRRAAAKADKLKTVRKTSTQSKTPRGTTQSTYGKAKSRVTRNAPQSLVIDGRKYVLDPRSAKAENRSYHAKWGGSEGPKKSTPRKKK